MPLPQLVLSSCPYTLSPLQGGWANADAVVAAQCQLVDQAIAKLESYEREPFDLVDGSGAPTPAATALARTIMEALLAALSGWWCCFHAADEHACVLVVVVV